MTDCVGADEIAIALQNTQIWYVLIDFHYTNYDMTAYVSIAYGGVIRICRTSCKMLRFFLFTNPSVTSAYTKSRLSSHPHIFRSIASTQHCREAFVARPQSIDQTLQQTPGSLQRA